MCVLNTKPLLHQERAVLLKSRREMRTGDKEGQRGRAGGESAPERGSPRLLVFSSFREVGAWFCSSREGLQMFFPRLFPRPHL